MHARCAPARNFDATCSIEMKWIAAMSLSCADVRRACVGELLDIGVSRVVLNVHDTYAPSTCGILNDSRIQLTHFSGMKARFWFHALDLEAFDEAFDFAWLIDSDVCPYTPQFSLHAVERWFKHGGAGVLQPSIVRTSIESWRRSSPPSPTARRRCTWPPRTAATRSRCTRTSRRRF